MGNRRVRQKSPHLSRKAADWRPQGDVVDGLDGERGGLAPLAPAVMIDFIVHKD
ncbi:MAG: hypothetical protein JNN08_02560 [Bryobacterales bacterium]|nr:hypothetical protein [Bryobacterales bacterium]